MMNDGQMICFCAGVTQQEIINAIATGAETLNDIQHRTGAGNGGECKKLNPKGRCCHSDILEIINQQHTPGAIPTAASASKTF